MKNINGKKLIPIVLSGVKVFLALWVCSVHSQTRPPYSYVSGLHVENQFLLIKLQ